MSQREMNPLNHLADLRREMDRLFDSFVGGANRQWPFRVQPEPPVNLYEDTDCLHVEIDVPGVDMADIEVCVADDELTIKGRRPEPATENITFHRRERVTGPFTRFVDLPAGVHADRVEAVLKNGVLVVTLPKTDEGKPRRINIKDQ